MTGQGRKFDLPDGKWEVWMHGKARGRQTDVGGRVSVISVMNQMDRHIPRWCGHRRCQAAKVLAQALDRQSEPQRYSL